MEAFGNAHSAEYALLLLAPLGFLPLLSPGRLAVALPLFLTLCLNEVIDSPFHHVHAAALPILLWSAAAGLGVISRRAFSSQAVVEGGTTDLPAMRTTESWTLWWGRFARAVARDRRVLRTEPSVDQFLGSRLGVLLARPLRRRQAGRSLRPRAQGDSVQGPRGLDRLHSPAIHAFRCSYDYSDYPRAVNNYQPGVPPDTDYIVIDTHGPYSKIDARTRCPNIATIPTSGNYSPTTPTAISSCSNENTRPTDPQQSDLCSS